MGRVKVTTSPNKDKKLRPALSPEARENQLIALTIDLVEQRLIDGTASSQETTHFLKLASTKHQREMEKMDKEIELMTAKTESIKAEKARDEMFKEAIEAMKRYSGNGDRNDSDGY